LKHKASLWGRVAWGRKTNGPFWERETTLAIVHFHEKKMVKSRLVPGGGKGDWTILEEAKKEKLDRG